MNRKPPRKTRTATRVCPPLVVALCHESGILPPHPEYRFDDSRRWRLDFAWPEHWVAVEVQGGLFSQGRHNRGAALLKEYEKLNEAQLAGWCVLLVSPQQWASGEALALVKRAISFS